MSVAELDEPTTQEKPIELLLKPARRRLSARQMQKILLVGGWIAVMVGLWFFYVRPVYRIGIDARWGFWEYWQTNRFWGDIGNGMQQGSEVLRDADLVAQEDDRNLTPAERTARDNANKGQPPLPTLMRPGPGLFDRPWSLSILRERWHRLRPIYSQIYRGWVTTYDRLEHDIPSGDYDLDYPPMRLMIMTLWTWKVQTDYPGLSSFPREPARFFDPVTNRAKWATEDVAFPLLKLNTCFDGLSAISVFFLVWVWAERLPRLRVSHRSWPRVLQWIRWPRSDASLLPHPADDWRSRWGDPALLLPPILYFVATFLRPHLTFDFQAGNGGDSMIDQRILRIGWWIFLALRVTSAVALARLLPRPFRGPMCGLVAATLIWLSPASILDSFGWPQWDVWLPPFFLLAALLVSLDWWLTAGLVLGVGCMFKGQLLFISPVLLLCPLFAGWLGKFMRILAGMATGIAIVVWPWMVRNDSSKAYIASAAFAAAIVCLISLYRRPLLRNLAALYDTARLTGQGLIQNWQAQRGFPVSRSDSTDLAPAFDHRPAVRSLWQIPLMILAVVALLSYQHEPPHLQRWIAGVAIICLAVSWRETLRFLPWITVATVLVLAGTLVHQLHWAQPDYLYAWTLALTLATLILPWFLPRRMLPAFVVFVAANAVWLCAFSLSGSFSWWDVGFLYGTKKHDVMQLGSQSLSNLSSILARRYGWDLHEATGRFTVAPFEISHQAMTIALGILAAAGSVTLVALALRRERAKDGDRDLPLLVAAVVTPCILFLVLWRCLPAQLSIGSSLASGPPNDWELRDTMATMYFISVAVVAAGAAVHLRRRDPRFLVAMVAPWVLFVALLPQLAARYTILPAIVAACLVGVSLPMSMFQMLLTTIACMMLGNQMLAENPGTAPIAVTISRPTHPDFGWTMVALALIFLIAALSPTPRRNPVQVIAHDES